MTYNVLSGTLSLYTTLAGMVDLGAVLLEFDKVIIMKCSICLKQCRCCMLAKACFERVYVFIALILFLIFFHLLVNSFTLLALFGVVNKDLQCRNDCKDSKSC